MSRLGVDRVEWPILRLVSWTVKIEFYVPVLALEVGLLIKVRLFCLKSAHPISTARLNLVLT